VTPMSTTIDEIDELFRVLRTWLVPAPDRCPHCVAELRIATRRFLADPFRPVPVPSAADLEAELALLEKEYPGMPRAREGCGHFAPHSAGTGPMGSVPGELHP
jgi:hypothetical protein